MLGTDDPETAVEMVRIAICAWRNARKDVSCLKKRIKRMEAVGDEMARWLSSSRNLGDDPFLSHKWHKAKEVKR